MTLILYIECAPCWVKAQTQPLILLPSTSLH